jgi:hypothetical protein
MDPDLSADGISLRLGDEKGNVFFISGASGPSFQRGGDWFIATMPFDEIPGRLDNRARVTYCSSE